MKSTYYHGTTASNLKSIKRKGLLRHSEKIWNPSDNEIYLWSAEELVKAGETEPNYANDYAKSRAYDSAQCAIAVDRNCGECLILEIELDDSEVSPDYSCENMSGAVSIRRDIKPREIKRAFISPDLSLIKGSFISGLLRNNLFKKDLFTDTEITIGEIFGKAEFYFEQDEFPLQEIEWKPAKRGEYPIVIQS